WMEQEPGSAGVVVIDHYRRLLSGFRFHGERSTGRKVDRALPLAAQAEGGTVQLRRGVWNGDFLDEVELFPLGAHDDIVYATTLAFSRLTARKPFWILIDGILYTTAESRSPGQAAGDGGV